MKIEIKCPCRQVCWAFFIFFFISACSGKKEEIPVTPPLTSPLSQVFIGFGVVNVSYTRITNQPEEDNELSPSEENTSGGYLRRGSVVRILERRPVKNQGKAESWVLVEASSTGWLKETLVDIYDSESQARTASESMGR